MLWAIRQLLLTVHILLAVIWVGGILFVGWGVFPAARKLSYSVQQKLFVAVMEWTHWLFTLAGAGVILTGILLGTVFGPISSLHDIWSTTFGNLWMGAFLLALFALFWGAFVSYPMAMELFSEESIWKKAEAGSENPLTEALFRLTIIEAVEVILFIIIVYLMVLL